MSHQLIQGVGGFVGVNKRESGFDQVLQAEKEIKPSASSRKTHHNLFMSLDHVVETSSHSSWWLILVYRTQSKCLCPVFKALYNVFPAYLENQTSQGLFPLWPGSWTRQSQAEAVGLGRILAWKSVPVSGVYGMILLDGLICPQTVWKHLSPNECF